MPRGTNGQPGETVKTSRAGRFWRNGLTRASLRLATAGCLVAAIFAADSAANSAEATSIVIRGKGFGIAIGTGGVRGGYYHGTRRYYRPQVRRTYPYRSQVYVAPRVVVTHPRGLPYTRTGLAPFTHQWVSYCSRKYRSFNPRTGTYLAYSGKYRYCR